jgi:hypothetical protein
VYKVDETSFVAPRLKTPGTVPPSPLYFKDLKRSNFTWQFYILYARSKAYVNTQKKLHLSWMPSGIVPFPQSSVPVWLFPGTSSCDCFRQTGRWCWCQSLGSHILAFNSVSLPSRRHESNYIEVNKLQDIKPSICVWQHTPATPRGRPSSSQAFRSVTFAYDESICWQPTRHFAAKKK